MFPIVRNIIRQKIFAIKSYGDSMSPLLQDGDLVYFKKIIFSNTRLNDIILIRKNKKFITHRVIYKTKRYLITKGDNNSLSDSKIYPRHIIAKAYQIKRDGLIFNIGDLYLFQSTIYFQEIIKIKSALEKEMIELIFLKGLPLHLYFQGKHPHRIYADCDILIKKHDSKIVSEVFTKFGYKISESALSENQKKLNNETAELSFYKIIDNVTVMFDIHLQPVFLMNQIANLNPLYPKKLFDKFTNELFDNKQIISIYDRKFFILNTEYLILYLSLHFFHHNFRGPYRLELIDKIIRKKKLSNLDWQKIVTVTTDYKLKNFVFPVFYLLKKYYQTPIPDSLFSGQDITSKIIYHLGSIFDDESRLEAGINRFKNIFFLSETPFYLKPLIFLNHEVVYFIIFSLQKRLFYFFSKN